MLFCSFLLCAAAAYAEPDAETLISEGKTEEAVELLLKLYPLAVSGDDKTQIEFLLGMASAVKEDYATAEWIFRRILKNRPELTRVRLELALLYFKTGRDEKADYHFRLVLSGRDLPEEVKQKIRFFLYRIRYRKKWDYFLNIGIAPSTNINNASSAETQCIDYFGIPLCRRLDAQKSSIGLSGYGGAENYLRLSKSMRWKTTLSAGMSDYSGKEYDMYSLSLSSGPLYNFSRGYAGVYAAADRVWFGGRGFLYAAGPLAEISYDLSSRVSLGLNGSLKFNTFDADRLDFMKGNTIFIMPTLYCGLSSKSYLLFKPSAEFLRTREDFADRNSFKYAAGFGTEAPWGISLYIEPSYVTSAALGKGYFVENKVFVKKTRRDESFNLNVRLLSRQINIYGFTPTLNYSYMKALSNIEDMGYEKHVVELGITNRF